MPQINTTIGLLLQKVLHLETLESRIVQLEVKNSQLEENFKILSSKFDEKSQPAVVIKSIDQQEQGIIEKGLLQDAVKLPNQVQNTDKPDVSVEKDGNVSAQSKVIDLSFLVSGSNLKSKSPPSVNITRKRKKLLGKKNVVEKSPEMILSNLDINSDIEDEVAAENNEEVLNDSLFADKKAKIEDLAYKLSLTQEVIVLLNKINDSTISSTKSVKETDQDHDVQMIPVDEISTPKSHQMTETKGKMAQPTNSTLHFSSNSVQSSASKTASKLHSPSLMTKLQIFHQCPVCAKNFPNLSSVNRHKKIHNKTGEMLFKCKICQKSFAKMNNYEAHLKTHQPTHKP